MSARGMVLGLLVALLVPAPAAFADVRVEDVTLVSIGPDGDPAPSYQSFLSADGSAVVFGDDAVLYARRGGVTTVVSLLPDGSPAPNVSALGVSPDGTEVLYSVFIASETLDHERLVLRRDLDTSTTELVRTIPEPTLALPGSAHPRLRLVASDDISTLFITYGPPFLWTVTRVDLESGAESESEPLPYDEPNRFSGLYSADGSRSVWNTNVIDGSFVFAGDVLVHDFNTGVDIDVVSGVGGVEPDGRSVALAISGDGNRIFFVSDASNLFAGDVLWTNDLFSADVTTGEVSKLEIPATDFGWSVETLPVGPRLSSDETGSLLAFTDPDGQAWLYDVAAADLHAVPTTDGLAPSAPISVSDLAADGTLALVDSGALNLTDDSISDLSAFLVSIQALPFDDIGGSIFVDDILWLLDQDITRGCSVDGRLFCPDDFVTRGQMAAFLNRALDLAPGEGDPFTDDDGIFEDDIEALAGAGITLGCSPDGTLFCPDDFVTRGQMAAFLRRALTD